MKTAPSRPRFWDKVLAVTAGFRALPAKRINHISYNALEFLTADYWEGGFEARQALVVSLQGFTTTYDREDVISLEALKHRLWDHELTATDAAIHFGDLDEHDKFIEVAMREHQSKREVGDPSRFNSLDPYRMIGERNAELDYLAKLENEWERHRRAACKQFEPDVKHWGSLELIKFVDTVCLGVSTPETLIRMESFLAMESGESKDVDMSIEGLKARWPNRIIDDGSLGLKEGPSKRFRRISFSDQRFPTAWLSRPADAAFGGKIVALEEGDGILFSLDAILCDPRCIVHTTMAPESRMSEAQIPDSVEEYVFRKDGKVWHIGMPGDTRPVIEQKGFQYIAYALERPGEPLLHREVFDVFGAQEVVELTDPGGTVIDRRSMREIKAEVDRLEAKENEAIAYGQPDRAAKFREDREQAEDRLSSSLGRGGNSRRWPDRNSRAKAAVVRGTKRALEVLESECPAIHDHLTNYLSHSPALLYNPPTHVRWDL